MLILNHIKVIDPRVRGSIQQLENSAFIEPDREGNNENHPPLARHAIMSRATPKMRYFAKCVIACEPGFNTPPTTIGEAFDACENLRPPLAALMGKVGFYGLMSRALSLAGEEIPWLRAVHVEADGILGGSENIEIKPDSKEIAEGRVVLLAQLLGLLVAFIGENLTVQLLRDIWPKLSFKGLELDKGGKNEE